MGLKVVKGNGNPLQDSCLGNATDRGDWRAPGVPEVTKSRSVIVYERGFC